MCRGGACPADITNGILTVWSETAMATGATLNLGGVQLVTGERCGPFMAVAAAAELAACQHYFEALPGIG